MNKTKTRKPGNPKGLTPASIEVNSLKVKFLPESSNLAAIPATVKAGLISSSSDKELVGDTVVTKSSDVTQSMVGVAYFVPTLGALRPEGSPDVTINSTIPTSAYKYFVNIRSKNVSLGSYSAIDLMLRFIAVDHLFLLMNDIRARILAAQEPGMANSIASYQGIHKAYNISQTDIDNLNEAITTFNILVDQIKGIGLPLDLPFVRLHNNEGSALFVDDPGIQKTQYIALRPDALLKLDVDATSATVGQLIPISGWNPTISLLSSLSIATSIINSYTTDQDFNNIFTEITHAYGYTDVITLKPIIAGETLPRVFDMILLDRIKNADLTGNVKVSTYGYKESSDGQTIVAASENGLEIERNNVLFANIGSSLETRTKDTHFIFAHDDCPSAEDNLNLCFYKAHLGIIDQNTVVVSSCGLDIITRCMLYTYTGSSWIGYEVLPYMTFIMRINQTALDDLDYYVNKVSSLMLSIQKIESFAFMPEFSIFVASYNSDDEVNYDEKVMLQGDLDNRYRVPNDSLSKILDATIAYLFAPEF